MRQSLTAVLERNTTFAEDFATEPYEVAWAGEARWFVQVISTGRVGDEMRLVTQVSPDGLSWCDLDGDARRAGDGDLVSWPVREFGNWLRLKGSVSGEVTVRIYLAVKS